jgi:hypothetical protein
MFRLKSAVTRLGKLSHGKAFLSRFSMIDFQQSIPNGIAARGRILAIRGRLFSMSLS